MSKSNTSLEPDAGKDFTCKICGKVFHKPNRYRYSYCSEQCRIKGKALVHRMYAKENGEHLRAYEKQRRYKIWGTSNRETGNIAELFAMRRLLPSLGFTNIFHASSDRRFVPFDFVATFQGDRVLVDVTTGMRKSGGYSKTGIMVANALHMRLIRVFIKPDFTGFMVRDASEGGGIILNRVKPLPK